MQVLPLTLVFLTPFAVLTDALLHSRDLATIPVVPLGLAYVLPLLFGLLSQAVSYRRSSYRVAKG